MYQLKEEGGLLKSTGEATRKREAIAELYRHWARLDQLQEERAALRRHIKALTLEVEELSIK